MSISVIFVVVSCCKSRMLSEGRPPFVLKSCTRILARRERDRGSFGGKKGVKLHGMPCWSRWDISKMRIIFLLSYLFSSSLRPNDIRDKPGMSL